MKTWAGKQENILLHMRWSPQKRDTVRRPFVSRLINPAKIYLAKTHDLWAAPGIECKGWKGE
jgi:hypothetical protein